MGRKNRSEVFDSETVGVYHCIQRAVRRAWLCGFDTSTGRSFEHRRDWIEGRLRALAGIFAFDFLSYAIMDNHLHVIVRNRPDIRATWTDQSIALRWWQLCPERCDDDGKPCEPTAQELEPLLEPEKNAELRARLGSISWLMRFVAEPIARQANREDTCTGRFWEGRFKCQKLVDETGILACSSYVDLNPIRAGKCETPKQSRYTSIFMRILAEQSSLPNADVDRRRADDWLAPIFLDMKAAAYSGAMPSANGRRASDKGFVAMNATAYLELIEWTGRRLLPNSDGETVPQNLAPVLERIGVSPDTWCEVVGRYGKIFKQAAGKPDALAQEAQRRGQRWLQTSNSPLISIAG